MNPCVRMCVVACRTIAIIIMHHLEISVLEAIWGRAAPPKDAEGTVMQCALIRNTEGFINFLFPLLSFRLEI